MPTLLEDVRNWFRPTHRRAAMPIRDGRASFARLRDLPFAELKLDSGFVNDSGMDRKNVGICQTIIDLAHNFGALAVAKGLACADDVQALHRMVLCPGAANAKGSVARAAAAGRAAPAGLLNKSIGAALDAIARDGNPE